MSDSYVLVRVASTEDWATYHRIRREELFQEGTYDERHPSEDLPQNNPLLLKWGGVGIGTARLDVCGGGVAIVRLVAVTHKEQGKGHGWQLAKLVEALAIVMGMKKLQLNARPNAVGYYEKLGYVREDWDPSELTGASDHCVQMSKMLC